MAGTPVDDFASVKRPSGVSHDLGLHSRNPWNAPGLSSPSIRLLESAKVFVQQILTPIFGPVVTIAKAGKNVQELRPARTTYSSHICHIRQSGMDSSRESGCCFCAGKRIGSRDFTLPFPLQPVSSAPPRSPAGCRAPNATESALNTRKRHSLRILFVDDDPSIAQLMRAELPRLGHVSTVCQSPAAAIEAVGKNVFDAAIVDLKMPGGSGWDVIDHLREHSPETVCVIITGHGDRDDAIRALRTGGLRFPPQTHLTLRNRECARPHRRKEGAGKSQSGPGKPPAARGRTL
ncbi:MAG UNVERIFIED_CONTAM: response regulator [Planctomycetaceae bacterium]